MSVCFFKSKHNQSVVFCKLFLQKKKRFIQQKNSTIERRMQVRDIDEYYP